MSADRSAAERYEALLAPLGPVYARGMFGGYGIYLDDAMLGLVADGILYLKVDDANRGDFESAGLEAFVYEKGGRPVAMSYHRAPEPPADWAVLEPWARSALEAARRARTARASRPARRRSTASRPPRR